MSEIGILQIW